MLNKLRFLDDRGDFVRLIDQFPIYELGVALGHLSDVCNRESTDSFEQAFAFWDARRHLQDFLVGEQQVHFSRASALELLQEIAAQENHFRKGMPEGEMAPPIEKWLLSGLKKKLDIFEHQLSAELKKTASYAVPTRGIFNSELLAEHSDQHIHESIRKHMSPFAINEYKQAGRCLAFGLYSASGFHSARSVEDVLRAYYAKFIGPPPDKPMGLLASNLSDLLDKKGAVLRPRENTVRHIRDVTNFDRNPLMHRNVSLEEIDATTLFNSALGVIVEMVKELATLGDQQLELMAAPDIPEEPPAEQIEAPKQPKAVRGKTVRVPEAK